MDGCNVGRGNKAKVSNGPLQIQIARGTPTRAAEERLKQNIQGSVPETLQGSMERPQIDVVVLCSFKNCLRGLMRVVAQQHMSVEKIVWTT